MAVSQLLELQECTVYHLKGLIHICLEPEVQNYGVTFISSMMAQSIPIMLHTEGLVKTEVMSTANCELLTIE